MGSKPQGWAHRGRHPDIPLQLSSPQRALQRREKSECRGSDYKCTSIGNRDIYSLDINYL